MTIVDFREARIAEDEAGARAVREPTGKWERFSDRFRSAESDHSAEDEALVDRFDPARVLAECAAKRDILERHVGHLFGSADCARHCQAPHPGVHVCNYDRRAWPCPDVVGVLAIHRDHPDFDPEWAL